MAELTLVVPDEVLRLNLELKKSMPSDEFSFALTRLMLAQVIHIARTRAKNPITDYDLKRCTSIDKFHRDWAMQKAVNMGYFTLGEYRGKPAWYLK